MADTFFSGLVRSDADKQWMHDNARVMTSSGEVRAYPPEFDPRGIIRVENQRSRNSCVGHGKSSCGEACAWIDSEGTEKPQYSRWGSYIWSQMESGLAGRDQGATISGAIKAAVKYGFCPESAWPYPGDNERYSAKVPAGAIEAAAPFKLKEHTVINGYADGFAWMNQGKGPLLIGIDWTDGLANGTGDITLAEARGRANGGHCVFLWGWDKDGKIWMGNSHSEGWGQRGWRLTRPEVIDYWCQRGDVYGVSDLDNIDVSRPVFCDFGEDM